MNMELSLYGQPLQALTPEPIKLPLVSFILRNWNYAEFVGSAIDSIKNQDYLRFEVIVVDNASTDGSSAVIERHIADDPRFTFVRAESNLGPMGGVLRGLDLARGDFIVFMDSDDYLMPGFASCHVQAHLAVPRNVAFTSSNVIEIDGDGTILAGGRAVMGREWPSNMQGLRPREVVPRLSTVSDDDYEVLHALTVTIPWTEGGWLWSPGTSNMYRRFVLEMVRPTSREENLKKMAADGHFTRLCHVLGGSALIRHPLSAYRVHGGNFFASTLSLPGLMGGGPASAHLSIRRQEAARAILERAAEIAWRSNDRLWIALDRCFESDGASRAREYANAEELVANYLPQLVELYGLRATTYNLARRMPRGDVTKLLRRGLKERKSWVLFWLAIEGRIRTVLSAFYHRLLPSG